MVQDDDWPLPTDADAEDWVNSLADFEAADAVEGLLKGDLLPLADFLDRGLDLTPYLRHQLSAAIRGLPSERYAIRMVAQRRGELGVDAARTRWNKRIEVGLFVDRALQTEPSGAFESVVADAMERWKVSRAYVTSSLSTVRSLKAKEYDKVSIPSGCSINPFDFWF